MIGSNVITAPTSPYTPPIQDTQQSIQAHINIQNPAQEYLTASNDFRSDFVTVPTIEMLHADRVSSLHDDWEKDPTTTQLETYMSHLTGHTAGLLVLSGTAANQISLRAALGAPPHSVLIDYRSHVVTMEAGAVSSVTGSMVQVIMPSNGHHLTLLDVKTHAILTDADYDCPTRLICLENTLNGTILPLSEVKEISAWARTQTPPIHMHLDGARLWEAVAAGAGSLRDYCTEFDSISLCFAKGLGAPLGSMIMGSEAFIKRARLMRKLLGGGMRQSASIAAPARVAVEETFLQGKLQQTHRNATRISKMWKNLGGQLTNPTETNMVWLDLDHAGVTKEEFWRIAAEHDLKVMMKGRLLIHYQISEESIDRLFRVFMRLMSRKGGEMNGAVHVTNQLKRKIDTLE